MADDQYLIEIRSDISDLRRDMETVRRDVRRTSNQMSRDMEQSGRAIRQSFTRAMAGIGVALAAIQSARALGDIAVQALGAAEAIQDLADRANVSAEFLQELRGVTQQSGANARDFDDAISRLNRRLGLFQQYLATGTGEAGPAANAFRALGLEVDITSGRLNDAEGVFMAAVDALQSVENQSQRAALASQLFGEDSGPRLVGLINRGTDGIRELSEEMREAGRVMSNDMVAGAAAASDELEIMEEIVRARVNAAVAENRDGIIELAEAYADFRVGLVETGAGIGNFLRDMEDLQDSITDEAMTTGLEVFSWFLQNMPEATIAAGNGLSSFTAEVEETADAIERVNAAIRDSDFMNFATGNPGDAPFTPEEKDIDELRRRWETISPSVDEVEEVIKRTPEEVQGKDEKTEEMLENIREMGEAMEEARTAGDELGDVLDNLGEHGEQAAKAFENAFVRAIETGRLEVEDLGRQILRIFAQIAYQETFEGPIRGLIRGVFSGGGGIGNRASGGPASGLTLVGEQGPELVNLGDHANVMTANLTRMAMRNATAGGGVSSNTVSQSFVIDARGADMGVEERLRQVLAEQAPLMQQRATVGALEAMNAIQKRQRAV